MTQAQIVEAYSRLKALRGHVPTDVAPNYVDEFHEILALLERAAGIDLKAFRIPRELMKPVKTGGNYVTGQWEYSDESFCEQSYFLMRVDGVLMMFELLGAEAQGEAAPRVIGFNASGH